MTGMSDRLGETTINNQGFTMFIVEYNDSHDIKIQFKDTGEIVKTTYKDFKNKWVKSHFSPSVFGFGIKGLEKCLDENGERYNSYQCWKNMIERCYSVKKWAKDPTYKGCTICKEWQYYKNFKEWYNNYYYEINNKTSQLDKDILIKGNRIYSPNTCIFVPSNINLLFTKGNKNRGDFPIGITQKGAKYQARCKDNKGNYLYLGLYDTTEKAFGIYKEYKENVIKTISNEYKEIIPTKLYEALTNYKVEITD